MGFLGRLINKVASLGSQVESSTPSSTTIKPVDSSAGVASQPPITRRVRPVITGPTRFNRLLYRADTTKSGPSERMEGYDNTDWKDVGYSTKRTELPTVSNTVTVTSDMRRDEPITRPINRSERTAWESQNRERHGHRRPQHEMMAIDPPGGKEILVVKGERTKVHLPIGEGNPDYDRIGTGSHDTHPHPTDLGMYLPTPSEVDHGVTIHRGGSAFSVVSPTKVYTGNLPSTVSAPKYQTENTKRILYDEGIGEDYGNKAIKKEELRRGHKVQRTGVLWNKAIESVANENPQFRNDPMYPVLKEHVAKNTERGLTTINRGKLNDEMESPAEKILPGWYSQNKPEKGLRTMLSHMLEQQWGKDNRKKGITGLTDEQSKIVNSLSRNEGRAYDKLREYDMARKMYSIGGDLREADFNKSDIKSSRPVEFREVSEKPYAVKDLRTEYRLLNIPHSELRRGRSERIQRSDRNVINRYDIPTTEVDWEAVNRVPMREKLSARVNRVTENIHNELFGGRSPLDETESIGEFGGKKKRSIKKRSVSNKKLDEKMDNILYGDHTKQEKKKNHKIKKDGWDKVLT